MFCFPRKEKDAGSKTFGLSSLCLCPIGRLIASVLHTVVIFMSKKKKKAKICNTIFSKQKELSIKCINIFDLNILGGSECKKNIYPFSGMFGEKNPRKRAVLKALSRG